MNIVFNQLSYLFFEMLLTDFSFWNEVYDFQLINSQFLSVRMCAAASYCLSKGCFLMLFHYHVIQHFTQKFNILLNRQAIVFLKSLSS